MTPLEAARDLAAVAYTTVFAEDYTGASWRECRECALIDGAHADDCPWLALPRIIAALEMLERMAAYLAEGERLRAYIVNNDVSFDYLAQGSDRLMKERPILLADYAALLQEGETAVPMPPSAGGCLSQCTAPHEGCLR